MQTYMVNDVKVSNVVQEEPPLPTQEISVDSSSRSTLEVPLFSTIMREGRISVVEVGNHNDFVVCELRTGQD